MDFQEFNRIFTADFNLSNLTAVRQNWEADRRYNRLEIPRTHHGLLLLTDYPACFTLPDGTVVRSNPGDLLLLTKGARYVLSFDVPPDRMTHPILINFLLSAADGTEISLGNHVVRLCRDDGALLPLFTAAAQLYKTAVPARFKAKVYELFSSLFPVSETDECCIGYINRHYTEHFSIPQLAKRCAVSETVYRKRFKQLTGHSPVQYINRMKIEKACQMVCSGDISPGEICDFLNFYSLPYFYKVFRSYTGLTPNQYRDQSVSQATPPAERT